MLKVAVTVFVALMVPKPPLIASAVVAPVSELSGTPTLITPVVLVMLKATMGE